MMQINRVKYKDVEEIPRLQINKNFKKDFFGSSPAPFIGRHNYPNINIGFLSPQFSGETSHYDSPQLWSKGNFKIGTIASMRYGLVNSRTQGNIKNVHNGGRLLNIIQEVGMAKKGVELEVNLNKQPALNFKSEKEIMPFGPQGKINKARITSNTKVDSRVERVVYDTDLKAAPGLISLYKKGFEESMLNKILSVGNLGIKKNRILVPTRWSITAVDDTVGKQLIKEIKDLQTGEYQLYFGGGWGNYYLVLFYPDVWSYELFETYLNKKINPWSKEGYAYSTDYENYAGRKSYAEECAGGYYAARLPILEKMKGQKRQQSALVLRFISQEYNVPLGVWVCREASRKSLNEKPLHFSSEELMLKYAKELIQRKFGFDLNLLLKESQLIKNKKAQKKLFEFN
jgi:DNA repair protein NreA